MPDLYLKNEVLDMLLGMIFFLVLGLLIIWAGFKYNKKIHDPKLFIASGWGSDAERVAEIILNFLPWWIFKIILLALGALIVYISIGSLII